VHGRRAAPVLLLSAVIVATSLAAVVPSRSAGADQIADLQQRATAVAQQLLQEQLEVGALQQQYSVIAARVASDQRAMAAINRQIVGDQQEIAARTGAVRDAAIQDYTDYGTTTSSNSTAVLFSGDQESAQAASEYSSIAAGNITTELDRLRTAQGTLQADQSALRRQQAADESDQSHQASVLEQADRSQSSLEHLHAQVTGQLASAIAGQAKARAAAAAAAVAAAQRAKVQSSPARAASSVSAAQPSSGGAATPAPSGSQNDPALNPFLQCVVQAESGGDYGAVSPNGLYMGAFQFSQPTWNTAAVAAGRPDLVGVPPNKASKADQDQLAVALYALDGERPWLGDRCSQ
jgi:peptidoglycan hydrolase CwlO-like protein